MKLLVLCTLAMMVTMAMSRSWGFIPRRSLARPYEVAMKTQIIAGFDRKLVSWLARHGSGLNAIQRKTLYFVNRRHMQTYWPSYTRYARRQTARLGRPATVNDYRRIGAEIGRRIPMELSYEVLVRRNMIPAWRQYMADLMAKRVEDIPVG
uniref:Egg-lysin n=1 Tax=Haliotis asinina TaxID=109174 RepID=E7CSC0_HALAI|nr:sperm lysin [Haliotis asinina]